MSSRWSKFAKIFGSGPIGVLVSIALFFLAYRLNIRFGPLPLMNDRFLLNFAFAVSIVLTIAMIVWSVKSLPAQERGNKLSTRGAFKYVRHPLYAAFLSIFNFGLAIYLNSCIFILWAILLHPVWHFIIRYEERLMVDIFGQAYLDYRMKTGRFFPRLWSR